MQPQLAAMVMIEQRETPRRRVCLGGRIEHRRIRSDTACVLRDLSPGGARLRLSGGVPLPDRFALAVECYAATHRVAVVWRRGDEVGVRFLADTEADADPNEADRIAALHAHLVESRAEVARLRARLAATEAGHRAPGEAVH